MTILTIDNKHWTKSIPELLKISNEGDTIRLCAKSQYRLAMIAKQRICPDKGLYFEVIEL